MSLTGSHLLVFSPLPSMKSEIVSFCCFAFVLRMHFRDRTLSNVCRCVKAIMSHGAGGSIQKARMGCCVVLASGREAQQAETGARGVQRHGPYPVCFSGMQSIVTSRAPAVHFLQLLIL